MEERSRDWLLTLFVGGVLVFNYPLLALFDRLLLVLGIPLLYLYLYGIWLALIVALALWLSRVDKDSDPGGG
jgi:hypothetical protein